MRVRGESVCVSVRLSICLCVCLSLWACACVLVWARAYACVRVLLQMFCVSPLELECHIHLAVQFGTPVPTPGSTPPVLNFEGDVTLQLQSE